MSRSPGLALVAIAIGLALPCAPAGALDLYAAFGDSSWAVVDRVSGEATLVAAPLGFAPRALTFDTDAGVIYAVTNQIDPWLATVDPVTGLGTPIARLTNPAGGEVYRCESLAFNAADGLLYCGVSLNGDDSSSETMAIVDPASAVLTVIGTISGTVANDADALAFIDGLLYAIDDPGTGPSRFYSFAIGSPVVQATLIGILNAPRFNNVNDLAFDPDLRLLYGFAPATRELITIDWTTGIGTLVGTTHDNDEFGGSNIYSLTIGPDLPTAAAPMPGVRNLRLSCAPNPFNPSIALSFELQTGTPASLVVHDLAGRRVSGLWMGALAAGRHEFRWDGRDDGGRSVPSGTYVVRLQAAGRQDARRVTLTR